MVSASILFVPMFVLVVGCMPPQEQVFYDEPSQSPGEDNRQSLTMQQNVVTTPTRDNSLLPGEPDRPDYITGSAVINPTTVDPPPVTATEVQDDPDPLQVQQSLEETREPDNDDCFNLPLVGNFSISQPFMNPYNSSTQIGTAAYHPGEDYGASKETPLYAIGAGRIITAERQMLAGGGYSLYGNVVLIEHQLGDGSSVWSQYAHMSSFTVAGGDTVERGDQIGTTGASGTTIDYWSPHLHWELRTSNLSAGAWPNGWSKAKILENYTAPTAFVRDRACANTYYLLNGIGPLQSPLDRITTLRPRSRSSDFTWTYEPNQNAPPSLNNELPIYPNP